MKFALDYDHTYSDAPDLWDTFVELMLLEGHEVMVVTFRDPSIPIERIPMAKKGGIPVFYTSYVAKRAYMESQGVKIDVWIDDSPETITGDSQWSTEQRERWKEQHAKTLLDRESAK